MWATTGLEDDPCMDGRVSPLVRWGLALALAPAQLVTGLWAVLAPLAWFDDFPGLGPSLIAADPPYNQHLATDAGAGFLATGVALVVGRRHGATAAPCTRHC